MSDPYVELIRAQMRVAELEEREGQLKSALAQAISEIVATTAAIAVLCARFSVPLDQVRALMAAIDKQARAEAPEIEKGIRL